MRDSQAGSEREREERRKAKLRSKEKKNNKKKRRFFVFSKQVRLRREFKIRRKNEKRGNDADF